MTPACSTYGNCLHKFKSSAYFFSQTLDKLYHVSLVDGSYSTTELPPNRQLVALDHETMNLLYVEKDSHRVIFKMNLHPENTECLTAIVSDDTEACITALQIKANLIAVATFKEKEKGNQATVNYEIHLYNGGRDDLILSDSMQWAVTGNPHLALNQICSLAIFTKSHSTSWIAASFRFGQVSLFKIVEGKLVDRTTFKLESQKPCKPIMARNGKLIVASGSGFKQLDFN